MKKILFSLAILVIAIAGWMMWMSFLNARTTITKVIITGVVDEVLIFQADDPEKPVIRIETHGQNTTRAVELLATQTFSPFVQGHPAKYYFVARAGDQTVRGSVFCCETGLRPANGTLTINGLSDWNFTSQ